jgi:hypothetical protein
MMERISGAAGLGLALLLTSAVPAAAEPVIKHVIVIPFENKDAQDVYDNPQSAPYINKVLLPKYAHAGNFVDPLPVETVSEPHYLWMEAGTNAFPDHTFPDDASISAERSTASTAHLATQLTTAKVSWMSYQEDMGPATGACPIMSAGRYAARHNPFVFFHDVAGNPPDPNNAFCAAHHRPYSRFTADLKAGQLASYVFITPNTCHDMHDGDCPEGKDRLRNGDNWLKQQLPPMIKWAEQNAAVIFIVWDEGDVTNYLPFIAVGPGVKEDYESRVKFNHGSVLKTVEKVFGLPVLPTVKDANDFADLFKPGQYP